MNYVFLAVAIVSEVIGTTFMKQSEGFTKLGQPHHGRRLCGRILLPFADTQDDPDRYRLCYLVWSRHRPDR